MRRKKTFSSSLLGMGILLSMSAFTQPQKPNIIYVFPDQFRQQAMHFWDDDQFKGAIRTKADPVVTPNLDQFAKQSVVFTNVCSTFALSAPHRGMLLSGTYPQESGIPLNCMAKRPISTLRQDLRCFSDVLYDNGYSTGYIGKFHLDYPLPNDPTNPGHYTDNRDPAWDAYTPKEKRHSFEYWYSYGTWDEHKNPHYYDANGHRYEPKIWSPIHEADKAIAYLKNTEGQRDPKKPFALFIGMNPPHSPYNSTRDVPEKYYENYKNKSLSELLIRTNADTTMDKAEKARFYFSSVTGVDDQFGRIVKAVHDLGLDENTIIIFSSDHGETMCSHGIKDPKNHIYEECYKVPFLMRWPKKLKPRVENMILETPDVMPTILSLVGLHNDIPKTVRGYDYSDYIFSPQKGEHGAKASLYIRNVDGEKNAEGKTVSYFDKARGVRTHRYSMEIDVKKNYTIAHVDIYDNEKDPYQMAPIPFDTKDKVQKELLYQMAKCLKKANDLWYQNRVLNEYIPYDKVIDTKI